MTKTHALLLLDRSTSMISRQGRVYTALEHAVRSLDDDTYTVDVAYFDTAYYLGGTDLRPTEDFRIGQGATGGGGFSGPLVDAVRELQARLDAKTEKPYDVKVLIVTDNQSPVDRISEVRAAVANRPLWDFVVISHNAQDKKAYNGLGFSTRSVEFYDFDSDREGLEGAFGRVLTRSLD